jgi:hypothetical protein
MTFLIGFVHLIGFVNVVVFWRFRSNNDSTIEFILDFEIDRQCFSPKTPGGFFI